jgi:hypothetical protein
MLIQNQNTVRTEDFENQQGWIDKLLFPLNQFILSTINAVNGNITFGDNIPCQTQTLTFTYAATSDFPKTFAWKYKSRPIELRVCQAAENGVSIALIPIWSYGNGTITISNLLKLTTAGVVALTAGSQYVVTLRVLL